MKKILTLALVGSAFAFTGASAQQSLVAGWDFNNYVGDGFGLIDGTTFAPVNTLDANYSSYDPTFGAGQEANAFGTLYYDGQFGSDTQNTALSAADAIRPTTGNLNSGLFLGQLYGQDYNLNTVMTAEGYDFAGSLSLQMGNPTAGFGFKVVFAANAPTAMTDWEMSFAGIRGLVANPEAITVEFSTDGSTWGAAETFNLGASEAPFTTTVKSVLSQNAYFRVSGNAQSAIDNVGIAAVPEPSSFAALAGLLALGFTALRRRRA